MTAALSPTTSPTPESPDAALAGWLSALDALIPTPPAYRVERVGRAAALDLLRCDEWVLDALVRRGLACQGSPGDEQFDYCDVMNLGLYSGSGRSLPEMGQNYAMRFARGPATAWAATRQWRLRAELRCPDGPACPGGVWRLGRPDPEHFGGSSGEWQAEPGELTMAGDQVVLAGRERVALSGHVETRGAAMRVRSPAIRALFNQVLADLESERYRFQWLPHALRTDPDAAAANRTMDCASIALWLERAARALGLEARTRKGWMLGLLPVEHGWAELRDEDGAWKVIDPLLPALARRLPGTNLDEFAAFCLGSRSSYVLPFACPAERALATHTCAGQTVPSDILGAVRPRPTPGG